MDLTDSRVHGGVMIIHTIHEGKHQYEVEKVVKPREAAGEKIFIRRGDKLMQINGVDLRGLTPEDLAQMLAEGNPMLTVHKVSKTKIKDPPQSDGDVLLPFFKDYTHLSFTMEMTREREDEDEEQGGDGSEGGAVEEEEREEQEVCQTETEEKQDLLIVTMTKTTISVVTGRGCDSVGQCEGCQGRGCTFHDVVMVSESSTVTLVPRGGGSFRRDNSQDTTIEHVATEQYLRKNITVYYYRSTVMEKTFRGIPVVLNFTDSDCFLRCYKEGQKVCLQVETCQKQTLRKISMNDETKLAFVFYMKSDHVGQKTFESAAHGGWFIEIINTDTVTIEPAEGMTEENTFRFVIQKSLQSSQLKA